MRITRADVVTYRGSVEGVRAAATAWRTRVGLLLRVTYSDGVVGQGEASPLPGYSPDSFDEARAALDGVAWASIPEYEAGEAALEWLGRLGTATSGLPTSAKFALETALLDGIAQRLRQPLWTLLRSSPGLVTSVPLCSLVGGADAPSSLEAAVLAAARGVRTVKVKIVGPDLSTQLDGLGEIRRAIRGTALRLDANRTLAPATAWNELSTLQAFGPELVEEPVPTAALGTVIGLHASPVPIALDESLQESGAWARLEPHLGELRCAAVVLKPMTLGGISGCLAHAARARAHDLDVTVSHAFDGPVALAASAHLALAIASRTRASGLDRHGGLAAWPPTDVPHLGPAEIRVGERPGLGLPLLPEPR